MLTFLNYPSVLSPLIEKSMVLYMLNKNISNEII